MEAGGGVEAGGVEAGGAVEAAGVVEAGGAVEAGGGGGEGTVWCSGPGTGQECTALTVVGWAGTPRE